MRQQVGERFEQADSTGRRVGGPRGRGGALGWAAVLVVLGVVVVVAVGLVARPSWLPVVGGMDGRQVTVAEAVELTEDGVWVTGWLRAGHGRFAAPLVPGPRLCELPRELPPSDPLVRVPCDEPWRWLEVTWEAPHDLYYVSHVSKSGVSSPEGWAFYGSVADGRMVVREARLVVDGRPGPPPPAGTASEAHARTPRDEAVSVRLTVVPAEFEAGAPMLFYTTNVGEVTLRRGLRFYVERWDGQEWVRVPFPGNYERFPLVEIILEPGWDGPIQLIPSPDMIEEPGRYRIVVPAIDGVGYSGLEVMTEFRVR